MTMHQGGHGLGQPPHVEPSATVPPPRGAPARVVARRPVLSTLGFLSLGATMVFAELLTSVLPAVLFLGYLAAATTLFIQGAVAWGRHRDPPRPRVPRQAHARRAPLPPEPPRQVHELARHCVICGRPLTNAESMRARVGSTCIQRYGPRYKMIRNSAHVRWSELLVAAEAQRATEQARLDIEYRRALELHQREDAAWHAEVQKPAGVARRSARGAGRRLVFVSLVSFPALLVGVAIAVSIVGP